MRSVCVYVCVRDWLHEPVSLDYTQTQLCLLFSFFMSFLFSFFMSFLFFLSFHFPVLSVSFVFSVAPIITASGSLIRLELC